jgi:hypothetical protein
MKKIKHMNLMKQIRKEAMPKKRRRTKAKAKPTTVDQIELTLDCAISDKIGPPSIPVSLTPVYEMKNALIEATMLGKEGHGMMSFMLHLNFGGTIQGFGGWCLDDINPEDKTKSRVPTVLTGAVVMGIMEALEIESWEALKGAHCRVKSKPGWGSPLLAIGHFLKDQWFWIQSTMDQWVAEKDRQSNVLKMWRDRAIAAEEEVGRLKNQGQTA